MDQNEKGLLLNLEDCKCLFRILKKKETDLLNDELLILHRIEKLLYSSLSIREIDDLYD